MLADLANPTPFDSNERRFFPHLKDSLISANLLMVSSIFKYDLDIRLKNKPPQFRAYGSYIFDSPDAIIYKKTIGSGDKAGLYDYRFDEYLMHRNATYGMFQNQISNRIAFSKFVGLLASNETWLLDFQISVPLPGKTPIRPYVEFTAYDDLDKETWNSTGKKLIYNLGLELQVIPDRLEMFFNLAQSSIVTDYQDGTNGGVIF